MVSSDQSPFNFLHLWVLIQQKKEIQGDVLLTEHIAVKHHQRQLTLTTACGHRCITCSPPLVRTRTLDDSYLDKEEVFCFQDMQAAIRKEQYSVWRKYDGIKLWWLLLSAFDNNISSYAS